MSRGRGQLRATLSADGWAAQCGRCDVELAFIVHMTRQRPDGSPGDSVRILRFDPGWKLTKDGVWVQPQRSQRLLAKGRAPWRRARTTSYVNGSEPTKLPARVECPACNSRQDLDPASLGVSATGQATLAPHLHGPWEGPYRSVPPSGGFRD